MSFFGITSRSYQLIATVWPNSRVEEVIIFGSRAKGITSKAVILTWQ